MLTNTFFEKFSLDNQLIPEPVVSDFFGQKGVVDFISKYNGSSFNHGLYRIHSTRQVDTWTKTVSAVFPQYKNKIKCFGYDWLGRQFAIVNGNETQILILDCDTGDVLEIPVTLDVFHDVELIQYADDVLAETAFNEWFVTQYEPLKLTECVSYKIPLYLGGKDEVNNRERIDMQVHWELSAQILDQTKPLKEGQRIEAVKLIGNESG